MSDDEKLARLETALDESGAADDVVREVRKERWPAWSLRNVAQRCKHWLNPNAAHHFPLVAYETYLAQVGVDPLADVHAEALAIGRERRAKRKAEAAIAELERVRVVKARPRGDVRRTA